MQRNGGSTYCDEHETKIDDFSAMKLILTALNFKYLVTVNKVRSAWIYKNYEISLDSVHGLGDFVEIEYKGDTEGLAPSAITEEMIGFLNKIDCGKIERGFRGYPYLLLEKIK